MSEINEHLVHAENNIDIDISNTFVNNTNAYKEIIQEIYNFNKYIDLSFSDNGLNGNFNNNYSNTSDYNCRFIWFITTNY